jgi:hypothetical protein
MITCPSTLVRTCVVSFLISLAGLLHGQGNFAEFPYNPDANGDDFVGTSDLLALLNLYGSEFSAEGLYLNEDTTEAVLYIGPRNYMDCVSECKQLPGNWGLPTMSQFPLVHEIVSADNYGFIQQLLPWYVVDSWSFFFWINHNRNSTFIYNFHSNSAGGLSEGFAWDEFSMTATPTAETSLLWTTPYVNNTTGVCFCAVSQRPRVEYVLCNHENEALFNQCVSEKLNSGWYPSGGTSRNQAGYTSFLTQSFWRWAE